MRSRRLTRITRITSATYRPLITEAEADVRAGSVVTLGRVGRTIVQAVRSGREIVGLPIGDDLDGVMTYTELRRHTKGVIEWPRKQPRERSRLD